MSNLKIESYGYGYDNVVVRGDKIQTKRSVYISWSSVDSVIAELKEAAEGLEDAELGEEPDYDGGTRRYIVGFRPMTEQELNKVAKLRKKAKEDAQKIRAHKEKQELETYNRLKKKYEEKSVREKTSTTRRRKTTEE